MSAFRSMGLFLAKIWFIIFVIAFVMGLAVTNLTSYSFLKPVVGQMMASQTQNMNLDEQYQGFLSQCNLEKTDSISFPLNMGTGTENLTIDINCSALKENGKQYIVDVFQNQVADSLFKDYYNRKVCSGFECVNMLKTLKNPLDIVTADFNAFLKTLVLIWGSLTLLFGIFVILLATGLPGRFISFGGTLIVAGLPYFVIKFIESRIGSIIPSGSSMAIPFIGLLMNPIANIFMWILILGVVCCIVGFGIKIYRKVKEKKEKKRK